MITDGSIFDAELTLLYLPVITHPVFYRVVCKNVKLIYWFLSRANEHVKVFGHGILDFLCPFELSQACIITL